MESCKKGHPFTPENTLNRVRVVKGRTYSLKECITCKRNRAKLRKDAIRTQERVAGLDDLVLGHYKEPLRAVPDGYGYQGTLAYSADRSMTQCHICGMLFKNLGNHIIKNHNQTVDAYREEFGLGEHTLAAPNSKQPAYVRWQGYTDEERRRKIAELKLIGIKGRQTGKQTSSKRIALIYRNKRDNCPDQLLDKILKLKNKLGRVPTKTEFYAEYDKRFMTSIVIVHGGWTNALKKLGLERQKPGVNPDYSREQLVEAMIEFMELYEKKPGYKDAIEGRIPPVHAYRREWGQWSIAKKEILGEY